jgi:two-component system CheB/CheR fusion protein
MVPKEVHLQLRLGIHKAIHQKEPVVHEQLRIEPLAAAEEAAEGHYFRLTIQPILEVNDESHWVLVVFEAIPAPAPTSPSPTAETSVMVDKTHIEALEQDLALTKGYLQTTIEELETTNEDVRAANEELQAANEELQSLNEELQTSQEELRSSNEELITLNTDHQQEIQTLRQSHDDVHNLLLNSRIAILFLNMALQIKHFTPPTTNIIRILASDVGRPLNDLTIKLDYAHLIADAESVLKSLVSKEFEVQGADGKWYNARIVPYRTADNVIAGLVMTFVDITAIKESKVQQVNLNFVNGIIDTLRDPILVLTVKMRVVMANQAFYQTFKVKPAETEQQQIYDLGNGQWNISQLHQLLEQIIPQDNSFEDLEVECDFPTIGRRLMRLNGRRLQQREDALELILLVIEDITKRR